MKLKSLALVAGCSLVLLASGTAAGAAIAGGPIGASGAINGCYTDKALNGSHVFVLQDAGTNCPPGTTAISWYQQGPAGPKGDPGTSVTVAQLSSGDSHCPNGGASITDGSGNTAYVCNGATGPAGPQGPQGPAGSGGIQQILGAPCGNSGPFGLPQYVSQAAALTSQASSGQFLTCG